MKRPTTLYRYDQWKKLEKHRIVAGCAPYIEVPSPYPEIGDLWRCRCSKTGAGGEDWKSDHYGFATLKEAKAEAIRDAKSRIAADQVWLARLLKGGE